MLRPETVEKLIADPHFITAALHCHGVNMEEYQILGEMLSQVEDEHPELDPNVHQDELEDLVVHKIVQRV
jgi:hypothetical protein